MAAEIGAPFGGGLGILGRIPKISGARRRPGGHHARHVGARPRVVCEPFLESL